MDHPYGKQYGQEGNPRAYMTMRDYRNLPYQWGNQPPVGRNPNPNMSMREYRDQWMSGPVYSVPSTYPPPLQNDHPEPRPRENEGLRYPSNQGETIHTISEKTLMREKLIILTRRLDEMEMKNQHDIYSVNELSASQPSYYNHQSPQSQQPPPLSPIEQAVLNLSKVVDTIAKEQKVHLSNMQDEISKLSNQLLQSSEKAKGSFQGQQYQTMVNEIGLTGDTTTRTDEVKAVVTLRSGRELKTAVPELVKSDPVVTEPLQKEQSVAKEENPEDEWTETVLVEQAQLQPQEELEVESLEAPEELQDASESSVNFWPWTKEKQISALMTEKSSGHGTGEGTQENIIQPNPIDLETTATAQDTYYPLPVAPSDDQVYILPTPAAKSKPSAPAPKGKSNTSLHAMQNIRRLVASVHTFATTSKKMANAYIAWHSGWFGCGFGF